MVDDPDERMRELARLERIARVAGDIMLMCNEAEVCPLCGSDSYAEDEHDPDSLCHTLDVALSGPRQPHAAAERGDDHGEG